MALTMLKIRERPKGAPEPTILSNNGAPLCLAHVPRWLLRVKGAGLQQCPGIGRFML